MACSASGLASTWLTRLLCCSAGIIAAKHTPSLIPMCHSVPLDKVQVEIETREQKESQTELQITATASATHRTGQGSCSPVLKVSLKIGK